MVKYVFMALILLSSCDSEVHIIDSDFTISRMSGTTYNVYFNDVGLLENEQIKKVCWNRNFIMVSTEDGDVILIEKQKVAKDNAYTGAGVSYVNGKRLKKLKCDNTLTLNED